MTSPLPPYLAPLTIAASWVYRGAISLRNQRHDRRRAKHVGVPVISVGNITTGGVGKTPMVMWIARLLLESGHRPAICMRGYGATADQRSDEQMEYEAAMPEVPVIANPDRFRAATSFLRLHPEVDCLVLDDGFQHRQMHRDLDLVLIDATCDTFAQRLLPAGHLREPLANLRRADAVIITHAQNVDRALAQNVADCHGREPIAWSRHVWPSVRVIDACGVRIESPRWLQAKRVATLLGVGNPKAAIAQLEGTGAIVAADVPVRDHQRYDEATVERARRAATGLDAMVVTGKDWVKLRNVLNLHHWPVPVVVPALEIDVFAGREALAALVAAAVNHHGE